MTAKALYLVRAANGLVKVGIAESPKRRLCHMRTDSPIPLELIHMAAVGDAPAVEAALHAEFAEKWSHGEWFRLTEEDVASIRGRYPATDVRGLGQRRIMTIGWLPEDYDLVRRAAKLSGLPMTAFVMRAGLEGARKILGKSPIGT